MLECLGLTVKAVVFDLDGTLAEFNLDYKTIRAETLQYLVNQGFPASIFSLKETIFEMLKKAKVYLRNNGERIAFSTIQKHVFSIALKQELKAARETSLLPGVFEILKTLKKMKLKLAVFTLNSQQSTEYILENFRVKQFFDVIVAREAVNNVKPHRSHLSAVLEALKVDADEAVVVGDSVVDMKSAKILKVAAAGIASDNDAAKKLNSAGASHIVESFTDLPSLIDELNGSKP